MFARFSITLLAFVAPAIALAADWKPAATPLMTKWGKKVTPKNAWREYPRPQLVRKEWVNLNGLWDYRITDKSALLIDGSGPQPQILVPFPVESALSGVGIPISPDQKIWYSRDFTVPESWKGKRVLLHFGAVDWEARVSINGKSVGEHRGGSDPFTFDISDALKDGINKISVIVWDPTDQGAQPRGKQKLKPESIWYTPVTGIWQTVWLEPVAEASIANIVPLADIEKEEIEFKVDLRGARPGDHIRVEVGKESRMTGEKQPQLVNGLFEIGKSIRLKIPGRSLWTPEDPYLNDLKLSLIRDGKELDSVGSYFAMRKIAIGKDKNGINRIFLNGKPCFQIGPLDQGWWPDGLLTPPSEEGMKYDLEVLKKLGFNMLRKHIKIEPASYYYHCDKLGLLVWQDMPSGVAEGRDQFVKPEAKADAEFTADEKKQFRVELKAMIDHLRFFPCIVTWVPFNEGWGQHETNEILKWVKEYDPTRLVDGPSGWADRGYGDMKDMHFYPGPNMFPTMPDRASVLGEFGGLGLPLKGHLWKENGNWGYQSFKTTEELRQNYHMLMVKLRPLIARGLSAAIYTQTTDVELEVNGLMTYDREIMKVDLQETASWHKSLFAPTPVYRFVTPTSEKTAQRWRYTVEKPQAGWEKPDFDASKWSEGEAGFGTKETPGAIVRTEWKSADIWLQRTFELAESPKSEVFLRLHHDEDAEIFINGVLAAKVSGWSTQYDDVPITESGRKALKSGKNTIAIHCHQTTGGQYIDVGLIEVLATPTNPVKP